MAENKVIGRWRSEEGRQKTAASLVATLPRLPLEHAERIYYCWKGEVLELRVAASWAKARIEIKGHWEEGGADRFYYTFPRALWQSFMNTCEEDPEWVLEKEQLSWVSGSQEAKLVREGSGSPPVVGTGKLVAKFSSEEVALCRALLPAAPKDYIQLELHGVLMADSFLSSTDGLVLVFLEGTDTGLTTLIPSEILSWSESLPGSKLAVLDSSFLIGVEGVVVEQSRFSQERPFPVDRVLGLRQKMAEATCSGVLVDNQEFIKGLRRISEWLSAGGSQVKMRGNGQELEMEVILPHGSLKETVETVGECPPVRWVFSARHLLLWTKIGERSEGALRIDTADKLPFRFHIEDGPQMYMVKTG